MKNLFIDSNIWLSLYHFTNDDLVQFNKLEKLIGKDIKLYIPQQVHDEVYRNRESKIKDAFKAFEITQINFPAFCKEYQEYADFHKDFNDLIHRHKIWKKKIKEDIQNMNLPADKTISSFLEKSKKIECEHLIEKAYMRYQIGNPPGKNNRYGDSINWECLLDSVPNGEDIYIISSDNDYCSEIFEDRINPFLENEWKNKKQSNIFFYKSLVNFLSQHFKDITLRTEQEKQKLIERLKYSGSFENTHGIIAMLTKHTGWTKSQIEDLCIAAENNDQVRWILDDVDVNNFYCNILSQINYNELDECATKHIMESIFFKNINENTSLQ